MRKSEHEIGKYLIFRNDVHSRQMLDSMISDDAYRKEAVKKQCDKAIRLFPFFEGCTMRNLLMFVLLVFPVFAFADVLGTMEVNIVPDGRADPILSGSPTRSVLVVKSEISGVQILSNKGIHSTKSQGEGVTWVIVEPGTQLFDFRAEGFQSVTSKRIVMPGGTGVTVEIKVVSGGTGARGSIRLVTDPPGVEVVFNEIALPDLTPIDLSNQSAGTHPVLLRKEGYNDLDTTVTIKKDVNVNYTFNLIPIYAGLTVTSDPSGATVFLDGDDIGKTPLARSNLSPGEKTVIVQKDGYEIYQQMVRLRDSETAVVSAYLARLKGTLEITVSPQGAEVWLNNESLGEYDGNTITRQLEPGNYTVRATKDGYHEKAETVTISEALTSKISLTLEEKTGAIFVVSTPSGALITLNDNPTGKTTPAKIEKLLPGSYRVSVSKTRFSPETKSVTVQPDATRSQSFVLKERQSIVPASGNLVTESGPLPGMTFVTIPAGSFVMGSNDGDSNEKPVHKVTLSSFQMMTTEVTQAMWQEVKGSNPSEFQGSDHPVEQVSWNDVQEFIKRLNRRDPGKEYRLPTEAEWEYACRAGTKTRFYWGDDPHDMQIGKHAWYYGNSSGRTHPVGQKIPNAWGLYDMSGNVWEWCQDWYGADYYSSRSSSTNPNGPSCGIFRVLRGGSWNYTLLRCRSVDREGYGSYGRYNVGGFRVVRSSL